MSETEEFARGQKAGRIDALLSEHSEHLAKINGSVDRAAKAEEALSDEIHKLNRDTTSAIDRLERELRDAIRAVASDVRTLNEDARLRDERVEVSRKTLAEETERRRAELADGLTQTDRTNEQGSRKFTKGQQIAALLFTAATLLVAIIGLWLATKSSGATSGPPVSAPSLTINQPQPTFGTTVAFTAVYPSAARKKIGQRIPFQPQVDVFCSQDGVTVYANNGEAEVETNVGGGWWQGVTGNFTLGGASSYGGANYEWAAGAADCSAVLGYFTMVDKTPQWNALASLAFQVT